VWRGFGVCAYPHFGNSSYRFTEQWVSALARMGVHFFRGMYVEALGANTNTIRAARAHGLKWGMGVCPEDWTVSDRELVARIKHIAANAADVCLYIEGVNEPNNDRSGGRPPADWVQRSMAKQRIIWNTVKGDRRLSHVKVLGPSLHAVDADTAAYAALGKAGLGNYMDFGATHCYPAGRYPDWLMDEKLSVMRRYWGKPAWITETGYTNALASNGGHIPVPEDVSAAYAPSALLEAVDHGCNVSWFELLDKIDPGAKNIQENNLGLYAMRSEEAPPWRPKPVVGVLTAFLHRLKDDGPVFDPPRIRLKVASNTRDVQTTVTAKRNGSVTLYIRRKVNCWDPLGQRRIAVKKVPVTITSARGRKTVYVDHKVLAVTL
jgi:hypothetical protein